MDSESVWGPSREPLQESCHLTFRTQKAVDDVITLAKQGYRKSNAFDLDRFKNMVSSSYPPLQISVVKP